MAPRHRWYLSAVLSPVCAAVLVTINNTLPRLDDTGAIMDVHDGSVQKFPAAAPGSGGLYWIHGAQYGLCQEPPRYGCDQVGNPPCGFSPLHNISVWSSPSLASGSWHFHGHAIEVRRV